MTIVGTGITTTTDEAGHFQLSAPPGRVVLRADVSGFRSVFNTFPDQNTRPNNLFNNRLIYNRNVSQFGLNGGFYYGKLELTFF